MAKGKKGYIPKASRSIWRDPANTDYRNLQKLAGGRPLEEAYASERKILTTNDAKAWPHEDDHVESRFPAGTSVDKVVEELYRKAPALQVADQILSNFSRPDDEPSLADLFIANTYQEGNRFTGRMRKQMNDAMLRYRIDVQKAHRFILDDQFVEYATEAASVDAKKILNRIHAATLPYEQTWIEFNLHKKVETIRRIHKVNDNDMSEIARRMGCLLQRINDTDFVATMVPEPEDGAPMPHLSAYFVTTREIDFFSKEMLHTYYGCRPFDFSYDQELAINILKEENVSEEDFRRGLKLAVADHATICPTDSP